MQYLFLAEVNSGALAQLSVLFKDPLRIRPGLFEKLANRCGRWYLLLFYLSK